MNTPEPQDPGIPFSGNPIRAEQLKSLTMRTEIALMTLRKKEYAYHNDRRDKRKRTAMYAALGRVNVSGTATHCLRRILAVVSDQFRRCVPFLRLCMKEIPTDAVHGLHDSISPAYRKECDQLHRLAMLDGGLHRALLHGDEVVDAVRSMTAEIASEILQVDDRERNDPDRMAALVAGVGSGTRVISDEYIGRMLATSRQKPSASGFTLGIAHSITNSLLVSVMERVRSILRDGVREAYEQELASFSDLQIRHLESIPADGKVFGAIRKCLSHMGNVQDDVAGAHNAVTVRDWWREYLGRGEPIDTGEFVFSSAEKSLLMPPGRITVAWQSRIKRQQWYYDANPENGETTILFGMEKDQTGTSMGLGAPGETHAHEVAWCMPASIAVTGHVHCRGQTDYFAPLGDDDVGRRAAEALQALDIELLQALPEYFDQWPGLYSQMRFLGPWIIIKDQAGVSHRLLCPSEHADAVRGFIGVGPLASDAAAILATEARVILQGDWACFVLPQQNEEAAIPACNVHDAGPEQPGAEQNDDGLWKSRIRRAHTSIDTITLKDIRRYLKKFALDWKPYEGKGSHMKVTNRSTEQFTIISGGMRGTESLGMESLWRALRQLGIPLQEFYEQNWGSATIRP